MTSNVWRRENDNGCTGNERQLKLPLLPQVMAKPRLGEAGVVDTLFGLEEWTLTSTKNRQPQMMRFRMQYWSVLSAVVFGVELMAPATCVVLAVVLNCLALDLVTLKMPREVSLQAVMAPLILELVLVTAASSPQMNLMNWKSMNHH